MNLTNGTIPLQNGHIAYARGGKGKQLLLAFHGYGHSGNSLSVFETYLADTYTIYYIDLPHHGCSQWQEGTYFRPTDLVEMVNQIFQMEHTNKCSLMGYSMGGRVCLKIMELLPDCIGKVVLMASDGCAPDPYYYWATQHLLGRKLFGHMLKNPKKYFSIINWLNKKKLLNKSLHKIATYYLGNAESRKLLALVWPAMSQLIPDIAKVRKAIAEHNIRVHVFSGLHDRLIPPSRAEHLAPGLPQVTLHILDKGHRLYDSSNAAEIAQYLLPR